MSQNTLNELKPPPTADRRVLKSFLRFFFSASLIVWLISRIDLATMVTNLRKMEIPILLLAFVVWQLGVYQRTWRWQILLRGAGVSLPYIRLIVLNYHALFFNIFLPTGFGGEIVRVITIEQQANLPRGQLGGLTILDRVLGLISASVLAGCILPFVWDVLPNPLGYLMALISIAATILLIILLSPNSNAPSEKVLRKLPGKQVVQNTLNAYQLLPKQAIINALAVSFSHTALIIFIHFLVSRAIHIDTSFWNFTVFTPLVTTAALLPSIQGLGVREGMYVLLLSHVGIPESQSILLGLGTNTLNLLTGLGSGIVNVIWPLNRKSSQVPHHQP